MEISKLLQQKTFTKSDTYEMRDLGDEMYQHFKKWDKKIGRKIFPIFSSQRFTHRAIRDAWKEYQNHLDKPFEYFMGILQKK